MVKKVQIKYRKMQIKGKDMVCLKKNVPVYTH